MSIYQRIYIIYTCIYIYNIYKGTTPPLMNQENISFHLQHLIDCCCSIDPRRRATIEELLLHPFLQGIYFYLHLYMCMCICISVYLLTCNCIYIYICIFIYSTLFLLLVLFYLNSVLLLFYSILVYSVLL